eukprot:Tamp_09991.p1 GENE.Tamp_09991~~Tamp_09991.p1  ORF type:complete len:689 (-),score=89.38 Tamp_09991:31-1950(-)
MDDDKSLLNDALKRAPARCHDALRQGWERQSGEIPLSFESHPIAKERCNPTALQVAPGLGDGMIRRSPVGRSAANYSTQVRRAHSRRAARSGEGRAELVETVDGGEPLAFIIIASTEQSVESLAHLLSALDAPLHSYALHLDASAPKEMHAALATLGANLSDPASLSILPPLEVSWGGPSMLQVELEGLKALLGSGRSWRHVLVISGSDFPVRSVHEMSVRYGGLGEYSHFEIFYQHERFLGNRGFELAFVECGGWNYKVRKGRRKPRGLELWGGSSWVTLSRSFSMFVTECLWTHSKRDPDHFFRTLEPEQVAKQCRVATDLLAYMEHTQSAEELFFHTVFMNTQHCLQVHNKYWRWVHWKNRAGRHCDKSDMCGTSPAYVSAREIRTAHHFTEALFARKFATEDTQGRALAHALLLADPRYARLGINMTSAAGRLGNGDMNSQWRQALDGNDYSGWSLPPTAVAGSRLYVRLNKMTRVCSVSISISSDVVLGSRKAIGVAVYHRTKAEPEWNASFPPTPLSAVTDPYLASDPLPSSPTAGVEAETPDKDWKMIRLSFASASAKRPGVWAKTFELRLSEEADADLPRRGREMTPLRHPFKVFEFQLHGCSKGSRRTESNHSEQAASVQTAHQNGRSEL